MGKDKIEGRWWIHGPDKPAEFGTLISGNDNDLSLIVKIPQNLSIDAAMLQGFEDIGSTSVPDVLLGRDAHNKPVTLFGCYALPETSAGLTSYKISVLAAVQGLELQSWSQECIHAVSLNVDLLHRWLGGKIVEGVALPGDRPAFTIPREDDLFFEVCPDVKMRIARSIGTSSSQDEYRWMPIHRIWLHFKNAQSLSQVSDQWVPWVTRLFSLLVGDSVNYEEVECYVDDPWAVDFKGLPTEGKLLRRGKRHISHDTRIHTQWMLAPYPDIANQFEKIVQSWLRVASEFEPVVDLFSAVAFHSSLHSKAEFLSLVQALEVYHARSFDSKALPTHQHAARVKAVMAGAPVELQEWLRWKLEGNYKYLNERLTEIFERHKAEAERLFINLIELPERIRFTRNHLTHYTGNTESPKYLKDAEMVEVTWYLRVFMWICLLKEIGVSGKAIERLIRRYADVNFVNLE